LETGFSGVWVLPLLNCFNGGLTIFASAFSVHLTFEAVLDFTDFSGLGLSFFEYLGYGNVFVFQI